MAVQSYDKPIIAMRNMYKTINKKTYMYSYVIVSERRQSPTACRTPTAASLLKSQFLRVILRVRLLKKKNKIIAANKNKQGSEEHTVVTKICGSPYLWLKQSVCDPF